MNRLVPHIPNLDPPMPVVATARLSWRGGTHLLAGFRPVGVTWYQGSGRLVGGRELLVRKCKPWSQHLGQRRTIGPGVESLHGERSRSSCGASSPTSDSVS